MADLLIRPQLNDHKVVENLLAPNLVPTLFRQRSAISKLVVPADVLAARPQFGELAQAAGVPMWVDPLTPMLQTSIDPEHRWSKLPFATAETVTPTAIDVSELARRVVEFELASGATAVLAPYLYSIKPDDPAFVVSLRLLEATRNYMAKENIRLPLVANLSARLSGFSAPELRDAGIGRFLNEARNHGVDAVMLAGSPLGQSDDGLAKIARVMDFVQYAAASTNIPLLAASQGVYGPAMVALGLAGYETGMGQSESTDISARLNARRPKLDDESGGFATAGVYIPKLMRSIKRTCADVLINDRRIAAELLCEVPGCCSTFSATVKASREHAVRARAALLDQLQAQPTARWRMNHIAALASDSAATAEICNKVLEDKALPYRIPVGPSAAVAEVFHRLLDRGQTAA